MENKQQNWDFKTEKRGFSMKNIVSSDIIRANMLIKHGGKLGSVHFLPSNKICTGAAQQIITMFQCLNRNKTELDIIENVEMCDLHEEPFVFVCLNEAPGCVERPLLCLKCLEGHKGHDWQSTNKFFTLEFKKALETGTSKSGVDIARMSAQLNAQLDRLRARVNKKIDDLQGDLRLKMGELMKKYPVKGKFGIKGHALDNNNAPEVIQIAKRQQRRGWIGATQTYYSTLTNQVSTMIYNLLDDFESYVEDKQWEQLSFDSADAGIQQFIKRYEGVFSNQKHYFRFSDHNRHPGIRLANDGLQAKFVNSTPSKPAVVIDQKMNTQHPTVYFQMAKIESKIVVFQATLVAVGVCFPKTVKAYGYRNLIEPSHGAYLMGSNGRSYHSSLPQYDKKDVGFSFDQGEVVSVTIDYEQKTVNFHKKSFFKKEFKMELMVKDEEMDQLRPCLMFHGEQGAVVYLVEEQDLRPKKGKKHKKKKKHEEQDQI